LGDRWRLRRCSGVAVSTHPGPFFRLGTAKPIPRFIIGFKAYDVFDFPIWAKDLDMPIAVPGMVEFKNNAQFLHCSSYPSSVEAGDV
jgi:hypothetical protein